MKTIIYYIRRVQSNLVDLGINEEGFAEDYMFIDPSQVYDETPNGFKTSNYEFRRMQ